MSQLYTVTAFDRRTLGHPNYWRAGRSWPSGQSVQVEVLDQDADPIVTEVKNGEERTFPDPARIGRTSWKAIMADGQLMKQPVGATTDQALNMQAKIDELTKSLATVTARADLAEQAVVDLRATIDGLREQVQTASERAESAEQAAGRLTIERDELQGQLEQLTAPGEKPEGEQPKASEPAATSTQPKPGKGKSKG